MTDTTEKLKLNRKQLSDIFRNNPIAIKAFENLFELSVTQNPTNTVIVQTIADAADQKAIMALDLVYALIKDVSSLLFSPSPIDADLGLEASIRNFNGNLSSDDKFNRVVPSLDELINLINNVYLPPIVNETSIANIPPTDIPFLQSVLNVSLLSANISGIPVNTIGDTSFSISLPTGKTKYKVHSILLHGNVLSPLTTAKIGLYTGASQGGTVLAAQQLLNLTSTAVDSNGSLQQLALSGANDTLLDAGTLYLNIGTPQGVITSIDATVTYIPIA